jgi:hypothetical protein
VQSRHQRKPPVEVKAICWTGQNEEAVKTFVQEYHAAHSISPPTESISRDPSTDKLRFRGTDGEWPNVQPGDWIVCREDRLIACKPWKFERAYWPLGSGSISN